MGFQQRTVIARRNEIDRFHHWFLIYVKLRLAVTTVWIVAVVIVNIIIRYRLLKINHCVDGYYQIIVIKVSKYIIIILITIAIVIVIVVVTVTVIVTVVISNIIISTNKQKQVSNNEGIRSKEFTRRIIIKL